VLAFLAQRVQRLLKPAAACRLRLALPSFNMHTDGGAEGGAEAGQKSGNSSAPMAEVLALARALEAPPVREISVYGGFPYAGGEHAGASFAAYPTAMRSSPNRPRRTSCDWRRRALPTPARWSTARRSTSDRAPCSTSAASR